MELSGLPVGVLWFSWMFKPMCIALFLANDVATIYDTESYWDFFIAVHPVG